jgi:hypothetical protein
MVGIPNHWRGPHDDECTSSAVHKYGWALAAGRRSFCSRDRLKSRHGHDRRPFLPPGFGGGYRLLVGRPKQDVGSVLAALGALLASCA